MTPWPVSPPAKGVRAHPTSSSALKARTQPRASRARRRMVCKLLSQVSLMRKTNDAFVACNPYMNINNSTSSCMQVSGYLAQCISTNSFTPPSHSSSQQTGLKEPNPSWALQGRLLSSFLFVLPSFAFQNLVAFYFAQVRVKAKRKCGPEVIWSECFVPFSYAGQITS